MIQYRAPTVLQGSAGRAIIHTQGMVRTVVFVKALIKQSQAEVPFLDGFRFRYLNIFHSCVA